MKLNKYYIFDIFYYLEKDDKYELIKFMKFNQTLVLYL